MRLQFQKETILMTGKRERSVRVTKKRKHAFWRMLSVSKSNNEIRQRYGRASTTGFFCKRNCCTVDTVLGLKILQLIKQLECHRLCKTDYVAGDARNL